MEDRKEFDKEYLESLKKWYAQDETVLELIDAMLILLNKKPI